MTFSFTSRHETKKKFVKGIVVLGNSLISKEFRYCAIMSSEEDNSLAFIDRSFEKDNTTIRERSRTRLDSLTEPLIKEAKDDPVTDSPVSSRQSQLNGLTEASNKKDVIEDPVTVSPVSWRHSLNSYYGRGKRWCTSVSWRQSLAQSLPQRTFCRRGKRCYSVLINIVCISRDLPLFFYFDVLVLMGLVLIANQYIDTKHSYSFEDTVNITVFDTELYITVLMSISELLIVFVFLIITSCVRCVKKAPHQSPKKDKAMVKKEKKAPLETSEKFPP